MHGEGGNETRGVTPSGCYTEKKRSRCNCAEELERRGGGWRARLFATITRGFPIARNGTGVLEPAEEAVGEETAT